MTTPMHSVSSSQISYIGYDEDDEVLHVVFPNRAHYEYYDVPKSVYEELRSADSVGSYFSKNIKNKYKNSRT